MDRRHAIAGLAALGILLIVVAIGSYKGWFGAGPQGDLVSSYGPDARRGNGQDKTGGDTSGGSDQGKPELGNSEQGPVPQVGDVNPATADQPIVYAIEGYVTTVDGGGVGDATIEVLKNRSMLFSHQALQFLENLGRPDVPLALQTTDASGNFRVIVPGPGRYFLKAAAVGYSSVVEGPIRVHQAEPIAALSIPLPVGYSITGTVTDGGGRPLGDVPMFLMQKGNLGHSYYNHEATSAPDGSFAFHGLEPTGYVLMVPPQAEGAGTHGTLIPRLSAPTSGLEVRLEGGRRFSGRVVEEERPSRGIAGASVTLLNPISYAQTKTDDNGQFEVFINGRDAECVIEHGGFLLHESRVVMSSRRQTFVLDRGAALSGRIVFPGGRPAADIELGVLQSSRFLGSLHTTRTDGEGRFELRGIDPSELVYVLPRVDGYWVPFGSVTLSDDAQDIVLEPTQVLTGTVVDTDGRALDTAWLHLEPAGGKMQSRAAYWLRGETGGWTNSRGEFVFDDVLPDIDYVLRASTAGVADGSTVLHGVTDEPVTMVLARGATLDFTLRDPEGAAAPSGAILVASWEGAPDIFRTPGGLLEGGHRFHADSYGRVIIDDVPAGHATFYFVCAGYVEQTLGIEVEIGEIYTRTVDLELAGELIVTTVGSDGDPVPMTMVRVASKAGFSASRRSGPLGVCGFASLPTGLYTVSASGFRSQEIEISGDSFEIELESR